MVSMGALVSTNCTGLPDEPPRCHRLVHHRSCVSLYAASLGSRRAPPGPFVCRSLRLMLLVVDLVYLAKHRCVRVVMRNFLLAVALSVGLPVGLFTGLLTSRTRRLPAILCPFVFAEVVESLFLPATNARLHG